MKNEGENTVCFQRWERGWVRWTECIQWPLRKTVSGRNQMQPRASFSHCGSRLIKVNASFVYPWRVFVFSNLGFLINLGIYGALRYLWYPWKCRSPICEIYAHIYIYIHACVCKHMCMYVCNCRYLMRKECTAFLRLPITNILVM